MLDIYVTAIHNAETHIGEDLVMRHQDGFTLNEMILTIVMILGAIGWIMNIYLLVVAVNAEVWGNVVLRALGVVIVPFGAVLGYIPVGP